MDQPRQGKHRAWLALLPLALLPGVGRMPAPYGAAATVALLLLSVATWAWPLLRSTPSAHDVALLTRSHGPPRLGAWQWCLLVFVLAVAALYIATGASLHEIFYNDGAYYYGVARHMALTGRFEEPLVWHFLRPPDRIVHTPFDYWGCLTVLLLVPPLAVFGATPETAFVTMSAITAASLLAFWYLICFALPLRYHATQLLALVLFAFSPALDVYRFQPESICVAQLFVLLALIALCRRRVVLAVLCAFAILLARGDGLVLYCLIVVALLLQEVQIDGGRAAGVRNSVLVALSCLAVYTLWSLASFGTVTPPGPQILPLLPGYSEVFDFGAPHERSWSRAAAWVDHAYVRARIYGAFAVLRHTSFTGAMDWWLAIAAAPVIGFWRRPTSPQTLVWAIAVAGYFLVAWLAGPGFAPFRTPHTFGPLVIVAGAIGLDQILGWLQAWLEHGRWQHARAAVVGAAIVSLYAVFLIGLPVLQSFPPIGNYPDQRDLAKLDGVLHGQAVASNVPWYMIAYTDSPTVSIPFNGEAAVEAVLARYQVQWLVIAGNPPLWVMTAASHGAMRRILAGKQTDIGRFRLERVEVDAPRERLNVYRVEAE